MNLEVPNSELPSKLLTPWWDVCIHYTTVAMMVLSLTAIGLQTTKDHLVCLPAVDCTAYERNQSAGNENASYDALNVCSKLKLPRKEQPSGTVVLTTMDDRRQYDYVDYECYAQISTFPKFFSLFFFGETFLLLIIFNFWLKYTKTSFALSHFENLLSDFNHFECQACEDMVNEPQRYQCETRELKIRMNIFRLKLLYCKMQYESEDYSHKRVTSVTSQYRLRFLLGTIFVIVFLIVNNILYSLPSNLSQCRVEKALFSTGYQHFECIRSIASYYEVMAWSFSGLLALNFAFVMKAGHWAIREIRWDPSCVITKSGVHVPFESRRDFAFLMSLLGTSNPPFQQMVQVGIKHLLLRVLNFSQSPEGQDERDHVLRESLV